MAAQSATTLMRLQYLASAIGYQLQVVDAVNDTFTMIFDRDRKTVHSTGVGATAAEVKTALSVVDPSITSAV